MRERLEPWVWLAEAANKVIHRKQRDHARANDGLIHAGTHDFEEEFKPRIKLLIAQTEAKLLRELASQAPIGLGQMLVEKNHEIDRLEFELALHKRPDER